MTAPASPAASMPTGATPPSASSATAHDAKTDGMDDACSCHDPASHGEPGLHAAWLFATFVGGVLIINAYLSNWLFEAHLPEQDRIVSGLCAMIGALLLSAPLLVRSARSILAGNLYIGELASLAVLACFATEQYTEAALVAFFLLLAEVLESRTAMGARAAVEELVRLTPPEAHRIVEGREEDVAVQALRAGDRIRVRPGENVPADGVLRAGLTTINQASVTGESLPVDKREGDSVFAGTVNLTGAVEVEVTQVGGDTTLGKVRELILQAEGTRLPIMRMIDRHVQWYTPTILMIAAAIWYFTGDIESAITALVVSCPCAVVLATPSAMVAGITCAARLGILFKNVAHLEAAAGIDAVVVDKTGTLTTGELSVTKLTPAAGVAPARLLLFAASADRHSNHPAARALVKVATEARVPLVEATNTQEAGGKGVTATIDGAEIRVGRVSWLEEMGIDCSALPAPAADETEGFSTIYAARDGQALGWIGMVDKPRPEARRATERLKAQGVRDITMLTGDRWGVARRVAAELGCTDVAAECLPETKLAVVESMRKRGRRVMVVGDGVNDAPALAAGDLGVAMGAAGNDVAIHSASIALLSDDLGRLPFMLRLGRRVRAIVAQNLLVGAFFVVGGLLWASMGGDDKVLALSPVVAALLHNVSSMIVIFNSARIVRFGEELSNAEAALVAADAPEAVGPPSTPAGGSAVRRVESAEDVS